ncbi:MAG: amino acid ABC transporter substrate-binding protein [Rhodoferax sp.]|nr:amino acid ABC transporter substrate-binding protein [Rhodoferax sp.]
MNESRWAGRIAAGFLCLSVGWAAAQTQGVSRDQILLGYPNDLSGPVAEVGRAVQNGVRMAEEEINAAGGVHGRKLRILVEDNGYDPKKGVLATQKLIQQDKVFAIVMATGTAPAAAALPMVLKAGIPHVCPTTAALMFSTPLERLSFGCYPTNGGMVAGGVKHFMEKERKTRFCAIYQDDDFGAEVLEATEKQLSQGRLKLVESVGYKRGATDFSAQVAKVQGANCDMLLLIATVPPAAAVMQEVQRRNWKVPVLGSATAYDDSLLKLAKDAVEGLYAVAFVGTPNDERAAAPIRDWARRYQARFGQAPTVSSTYGYMFTQVFAEGARLAGPDLTVDSFIKGMESMKGYRTVFGATFGFSPNSHLGVNGGLLYRVESGSWKFLGDL